MKRAVTAVSAAPAKRRFPLTIIAALGCAILIVVVLLGGTKPVPDTAPAPTPSPAPDRPTAASAALKYTQELAVTGVRRPAVFGRRLREIAAPGAVDDVRSAFGEGARQVRALVRGRRGVLRAAPIGYRIESFDAAHATVAVWMVALAGGPRLEPIAQWRVLTIDLQWTERGWKVAGGRGGRGPSPRMPLATLAVETATFEEVRHVP